MASKFDSWKGAHRLRNRNYPPTKDEVDRQLYLLAELLNHAFQLHRSNIDLLGDEFLMYLGNSILRDWPRKELHKISVKAEAKFNELANKSLVGLNRSEVQSLLRKSGYKMSDHFHHEHNPPISFFRDLPRLYDNLSTEIIFTELKENYEVVWITKEENDALNSAGFRSKRTKTTYKELGIDLIEENIVKQNNR